jgi:WD40 repeat protein
MAILALPQPGTALVIDPAQSFLLVGCEDGHIYQFPIKKTMETEPKLIFKGHSQKINGLDLSLDGQLLVSASSDHSAIVWDVSSRQVLRRFTQHESPLVSVKIMLSPPNLEISDMAKDRMPNVKQFKRNPSAAETYLPVLPAGKFKRELILENESEDEDENLLAVLETFVIGGH